MSKDWYTHIKRTADFPLLKSRIKRDRNFIDKERLRLYNYIRRHKNMTGTFYHGTSQSLWDSIKKSGFFSSPAARNTSDNEQRTRGLDQIFYTTNLNYSWYYAKRESIKTGSTPLILQLEIPLYYLTEINEVILRPQNLSRIYNEFNLHQKIEEIVRYNKNPDQITEAIIDLMLRQLGSRNQDEFTTTHLLPVRFVKKIFAGGQLAITLLNDHESINGVDDHLISWAKKLPKGLQLIIEKTKNALSNRSKTLHDIQDIISKLRLDEDDPANSIIKNHIYPLVTDRVKNTVGNTSDITAFLASDSLSSMIFVPGIFDIILENLMVIAQDPHKYQYLPGVSDQPRRTTRVTTELKNNSMFSNILADAQIKNLQLANNANSDRYTTVTLLNYYLNDEDKNKVCKAYATLVEEMFLRNDKNVINLLNQNPKYSYNEKMCEVVFQSSEQNMHHLGVMLENLISKNVDVNEVISHKNDFFNKRPHNIYDDIPPDIKYNSNIMQASPSMLKLAVAENHLHIEKVPDELITPEIAELATRWITNSEQAYNLNNYNSNKTIDLMVKTGKQDLMQSALSNTILTVAKQQGIYGTTSFEGLKESIYRSTMNNVRNNPTIASVFEFAKPLVMNYFIELFTKNYGSYTKFSFDDWADPELRPILSKIAHTWWKQVGDFWHKSSYGGQNYGDQNFIIGDVIMSCIHEYEKQVNPEFQPPAAQPQSQTEPQTMIPNPSPERRSRRSLYNVQHYTHPDPDQSTPNTASWYGRLKNG